MDSEPCLLIPIRRCYLINFFPQRILSELMKQQSSNKFGMRISYDALASQTHFIFQGITSHSDLLMYKHWHQDL